MSSAESGATRAQTIGDHAVMIGASMAGLLAARVLSDAYERVTIIERDELLQWAKGGRRCPRTRPGRPRYPVLLNRFCERPSSSRSREERLPRGTTRSGGRANPSLGRQRQAPRGRPRLRPGLAPRSRTQSG
jgi:hypothetical protein